MTASTEACSSLRRNSPASFFFFFADFIFLCLQVKNRTQCGGNNMFHEVKILYCHTLQLVFIALQGCSYVPDESNLSEYTVSHEAKQANTSVPPMYCFLWNLEANIQNIVTEMLIYYTELCCLLFERCLDAAIVRRLQTLKCGCQLVLWFLAYRFSMAAVELRMPDLFGCDQCKRTEDEKWHCLNHKAHNPKISCCKAATIVSCETNSRPTSVEAARVSAFHIVKPQKPQLSPFPFENDWQCAVRDMQREPGRFLRGHVTSKLFIWTVCPQSAADGTKWAVKMEHGAVIFGIQMQRESRFSSTSSASVFHLSHLHISVECSRCSSEGVVYTSVRNLYSAMTSTAHKIFKNKNSLKSSAHLWAVQGSTFMGALAAAFSVLMGCRWSAYSLAARRRNATEACASAADACS